MAHPVSHQGYNNQALQDVNMANEDRATPNVGRSHLARKVSKLCLGILAITVVANIPTAEAGPFAGGLCLLACIPLVEAPPLLAVCLAACGVATTIPGP